MRKILLVLFWLIIIIAIGFSAFLISQRSGAITSSAYIEKQNQLAQSNPRHYLKARMQWIDYKDISPNLVLAAIASEDQSFLQHNGFDFVQILSAIRQKDKNLRGASTISQQLVKNLFLWSRGNKVLRKTLEIMMVPFVELWWSKQRILEVYLNVVQFDAITYGVELASLKYFQKSAKHLNLQQAAWLIAVLPAPVKYSIKNPSTKLSARQARIVKQAYLIRQSGLLKPLIK